MKRTGYVLVIIVLAFGGVLAGLCVRLMSDRALINGQRALMEELRGRATPMPAIPFSPVDAGPPLPAQGSGEPGMTIPEPPRNMPAADDGIERTRQEIERMRDPTYRAQVIVMLARHWGDTLRELPPWVRLPEDVVKQLSRLLAEYSISAVEQNPAGSGAEAHVRVSMLERMLQDPAFSGARLVNADYRSRLGEYGEIRKRYEELADFNAQAAPKRRLEEEKMRLVARLMTEADTKARSDAGSLPGAFSGSPGVKPAAVVLTKDSIAWRDEQIRARARPHLTSEEFEMLNGYLGWAGASAGIDPDSGEERGNE